MRVCQVLSVILVLGGCAAGQKPASAVTVPEAGATSASASASLEQRQGQQQARIQELESRIALLEVESRRMRSALRESSAHQDTVRIAAPTRIGADESVVEAEPAEVVETHAAERRPVLRLYGQPKATAESMPLVGDALPVVPLPEERAKDDTATQGYRDALRALREQRYEDASQGFEAFAKANPKHALAGSALYWSGEAHYAKRDYDKARAVFDQVLAQFAQSDKVPDALVKLGLTLRRLGNEEQAQLCFRRVREKYPNTQAAAIALREGST
jgi:tol-pal system protein YbgF